MKPVATLPVRVASAVPHARKQRQGVLAGSKLDAAVETITRILLAPVFLVRWLADLPQRVTICEPEFYGRCKWQEPFAEGTIPLEVTEPFSPRAKRVKTPLDSSNLCAADDHAADGMIILQRFQESWKDSVMLTIQGIIYYAMQHSLRLFAIDHLLFMFRHDIQKGAAHLTGAIYTTEDSTRVPLSLLAAMATDQEFSLPTHAAAEFPFPHHHRNSPDLANDHFLIQCSRLVYEDAGVIQDVVASRWRMAFHGHQSVPAHNSRHCWVPDVCYFACSNAQAFVLSIKGADPLWQLGLAADPPTSKAARSGIGQVHNGLWQGLHQADPFCRSQTMYDVLVAHVRDAHEAGKDVYLTGHSLGGALVTVFATVLLERHPKLAACVKGIATFAAPRAGNAEFAQRFDAAYGKCSRRIVNASDMVVMLPPRGLGYVHTSRLQHLCSHNYNGSRVLQADEMSPAVLHEDRWGYVHSLRRMMSSLPRGENMMRCCTRLAMLPVPGFSDHLPSDYETVIREELIASIG